MGGIVRSKRRNPPSTDSYLFYEPPQPNIGTSLQANEEMFKTLFENCSDVHFRELTLPGCIRLLMIYVDGMINTEMTMTNVLKPLLYEGLPQGAGALDSVSQLFDQELFSILQTKKNFDVKEITEHVLKGNIAILADGEDVALLAELVQFKSRAIGESSGEITLRGSRESFTEDIRTNATMLRRILATPRLKMEALQIGTITKTDVILAYLEGIPSSSVLNEVRERLQRIQVDDILESGYIEEHIEDNSFSPFPQLGITERPDVVAAGLLEGQISIIANGSPFVLLAPMTFWGGLQAPDDYYERFVFVTFSRAVRYLFTFFSVLFPSIYTALTNFHPEMVPSKLMISVASLREHAPFPTVIEVFMMELMFEGLREAGIRLPHQIGPLVSVAGALVIGEAAVRAGIISAPIVIVVSAAGIASFVIPRYRAGYPLRILRFPFIILSGTFGLLGLAIGIITVIIHMVHLNSFGTPYLTPLAPMVARRIKDVFIRWPHKFAKRRRPVAEGDNP